jgi:hypothetical protein
MNRPENSDSNSPPPRRERKEMDIHERRLWDLDDGDDLLESEDEAVSTDSQAAPPPETTAPAEPSKEVAAEPRDREIEQNNSTREAPRKENRKRSAKEGASDAPSPKEKTAETESSARARNSSVEKISLGVFFALILGIVVGVFYLFFHELPTTDPTVTAKFPVTGKNVVVKEIDTYWRKPDPSKDRRGVKTSAKAIPAGILTLGESKGTSALRIFFEDDEANLAGDPVTLAISNGLFTKAKKASLEVHGTEGFSDLGDLPTYLTGQIELWYMVVKEGPSPDARGNQFKEILRLPIEPKRR